MINIKELKNKFYNQHFTEFLDFVNNTDLRFDWNLVLNNTLSRLNKMMQEKGEPLYSITREEVVKDGKKSTLIKGPGLKANAEEQEAVVSIEEFFDIVEYNKELAKLVDRILTYMEDQKGNGSEPELAQTTEDLIHKEICRYFWEKQGKLRLEYKEQEKEQKNEQEKGKENDATDVQEQDQTQETNLKKFYDYDWLDTKDATAKNIISGPLFLLMGRYHYTISLLHICRKIRNRDIHGEERFFGLRDGYIINCFRLFTYIATVMLLRRNLQEQYNLPKYKFVPRDLKVIAPENAEVKLWCGREEITPDSHKNNPLSYKVFWYKSYKLEIEIKEKLIENFEPNWTYQTPTAACHKGKLEVIPNDSQGSSLLRNSSFHEVMKAVNHGLEDMRRIGDTAERIEQQTGDISDKLDILEEIYRFLQEKYGQQEIFNHQVTELLKLIVEQNGKGKDVKTIIDQEGIKGRRKWIRWGIFLILICFAIGLVTYSFKDAIIDHFLTAEEIIEKTDARFLKLFFETPQEKQPISFNDISEIGTEYRRAIKKYEDSLKVDSNNINAHLALAHMFIQGKGKYSLSEALVHAQSAANHSSRGKGLYCYLLHSLGKDSLCYDYMFEHYLSPDSFVVGEDEYLTLTKALWLVYGHDEESRRQRTLTSTLKGLKIINSLFETNLDAAFERADMSALGVRDDEKKRYYYIAPDPIYSFYCLHYLTEHSYPIALLLLSEAEYNLNCIEAFINSCSFAVGAGISQAAPLLRSRIEQVFAGTDNSQAIKYLQQIQELEEGNNFGTKIARLFRAFNSHGQRTRQQTLQELDSLIARAEKGETDQYLVDLEDLYRARISLCLQLNDTLRATELAMQKDACQDTLAVRQYIKAVWLMCYKDSTTHQDSIMSERLINISARRGYSQAIYTWLQSNTGVDVVTLLGSSTWDYSYSSNLKSATGNMISLSKPDPSEWMTDSLWQNQPLLAWALAEYWNGQKEDLFLPYTPEEYQAMIHLMDYKKEEPYIRSQLEDYKWHCQWGIAHAIEHRQPVIAYLLAHEWLEVMDALDKYYGETTPFGKNYYYDYQDIAERLENYQKELKANGRYIKPNYPFYAY